MVMNPFSSLLAAPPQMSSAPAAPPPSPKDAKAKKVFNDFVGQTFYGQMLKAMRSTVDKPAYFHGGRAEEMFQSQLDQTIAEKLAEADGERFSGPMFNQFLANLPRQP